MSKPSTPLRSMLALAAGFAAMIMLGAAAQDQGGQQAQQDQAEPPVQQQEQAGMAQPADSAVPSGEDVAQGVFVRDSAMAVDQFVLAERMERLRDWTKAAEVYQDVISRFGDWLIADRVDVDGKVYQYASVGRAVQRKLAAWPPEGRTVYERKFGAAARALLDQAMAPTPPDADQLQRVVRLYFITEAGRDAAILLIDRQLADGSFAAARRLSRELLEMHPNQDEHRPRALLRALAAAHFLGDEEAAAEHAQEIAAQFAQASDVIAGEQQSIADAARQILESKLVEGIDTRAGDWPSFGGSDDRARLAHALSSQIAPYVQDIRVPETSLPDRGISPTHRKDLENARLNGQLTGIFPVASDGALYWSDNIHIFAVALDSGLPLPGWLDTYGSSGSSGLAGYGLPGGGYVTPRGMALTPAVTERVVVANMGLRDERLSQLAGNPAVPPARLVCLDRLTGRPLWSAMPSELDATLLGDPALQADLGECQFVGTPLVVGDAVWTLARTDPRNPRQFEQCFLVSFDLESGAVRTITYLASSTSGDPMARWGRPSTVLPEPASIIAYSDGLIYAPTDTGAIAAVRASDGGVEWMNLYPRIPIDPISRRFGAARLRPRTHTESQPFHAAPVIVDGGRVFFKPPDSRHLLIWNAADGDEVLRIDLSSVDGDRTLLKVLGDRVLTFGSQGVSCIDWTQVRDGVEVPKALKWATRVPAREEGTNDDTIIGRPAVTQSQLLIPTAEHLRLINLSDGRFVASYPTGGATWTASEEPGNVIVLQDQLVIAGPSRLNVYADSSVIRDRLQQQIMADPTDTAPLLRLAQIAFVTGDFEATQERLRQAEQVASAGAAAAQQSVFATSLGFAQTLSERLGNALAPGSPTVETVERFFSLAEKFARSPAQNVRVRFARAEFVRSQADPQRCVALLQEILADEQWRQVPVVPETRDVILIASESFSPRQAGEVARELLASVIASAGPQVYAEIEQRAAEEVADATAAGDVGVLLRLSDAYPNSAAAQEALAEAARLLQAQNRHREAATALRRLASRGDDPLAAWLRLAQIDARRPGRLDSAAGRMRRAARLRPDAAAPAITLPDGTSLQGLSVEQAAEQMTEAAFAAEVSRLADLHLPDDPTKALFQESATTLAGIEALLIPQEGFERNDRIVVLRSDGTLATYAFGAAEPVWAASIEEGAAQAIAWLPQGLLVWGDSAVALLDSQSGEPLWRRTVDALLPESREGERVLDRAVVATGWRATAQELEVLEAQNLAEQRALERAAEQQVRGGRGRMREEMLRAQERREAIDQQRRANANLESNAESALPANTITAVLPSAGTIGVILGPQSNSVTGLQADDGRVQWRAMLPEGEVHGAHGAADFLAVQTVASRTILSALDLDSGAIVTRRSFDLTGAEALASFLITPENELVYATRQQVMGVDLERQPQAARFTVRPEPLGENQMALAASAGPGRLRIIGDKLLVLIDPHRVTMDQLPRRDALVIDLEAGRPHTTTDAESGLSAVVILSAAETGAGDAEADALPPRLRAQQRARMLQAQREAARVLNRADLPGERIWSAGTSLYITADRGLSAYDLKVPGRHWNRLNASMVREFDPAVNLAVAIGRDDLVLFDHPLPTPRRKVQDPIVRVTVFSRDRLKDGRESGQQRHEVELVAGAYGLDAPVSAFQAADGGIAVLSRSGRLSFLRGGE